MADLKPDVGGWDEATARRILASSTETIEFTTNLARQSLGVLKECGEGVQKDVDSLRQMVQALQDRGLSGPRTSGHIRRSEARDILAMLRRLEKALDVHGVIKQSLDLTKQTSLFVTMMEQIERRYGEADRKAERDLTRSLKAEQLLQVYQWIEQNELEAIIQGEVPA